MQNKQLTAEDCNNITLPLSEKDFKLIDSLSSQEYGKLPLELRRAYQEYSDKEWKAKGYQDWE